MDVAVFEGGPDVGGMTKSFDIWGHRVDLGPHRFLSKSPRVNALWLEMAGDDYHMIDRKSRLLYNQDFYTYPLAPGEILSKFRTRESLCCAVSYLKQRLKGASGADSTSFEDWVVARFGRRLFEIFFKSYSEKLWGIPCDRIDADFAAQRIKGFSLFEALLDSLPGSRRGHATLVDRFAYPLKGAGEIYRRMAREIRSLGGTVRLGAPVEKVLSGNGRVEGLRLVNDEVIRCGSVVSTMPLDTLVKGLDVVPPSTVRSLEKLRFRNTLLVYLRIEGTGVFSDNLGVYP